MIRFTRYQKYFGKHLIVSIPSLELPQHIYWLRGDNGSGKTTLLKSVAGLIPFDGDIEVEGINIRRQRTQYRLAVNYAEAEPAYPGFLTGSDLVRFYTDTKKAGARQADELIAAFSMGDYIGNKIGTYSSGMAKKLSLVLGFIGQPKLILLDEPLITLDVKSVSVLQQLIGERHRMGIAFLITSHQEMFAGGAIAGQAPQPAYSGDKIIIQPFSNPNLS